MPNPSKPKREWKPAAYEITPEHTHDRKCRYRGAFVQRRNGITIVQCRGFRLRKTPGEAVMDAVDFLEMRTP